MYTKLHGCEGIVVSDGPRLVYKKISLSAAPKSLEPQQVRSGAELGWAFILGPGVWKERGHGVSRVAAQ